MVAALGLRSIFISGSWSHLLTAYDGTRRVVHGGQGKEAGLQRHLGAQARAQRLGQVHDKDAVEEVWAPAERGSVRPGQLQEPGKTACTCQRPAFLVRHASVWMAQAARCWWSHACRVMHTHRIGANGRVIIGSAPRDRHAGG